MHLTVYVYLWFLTASSSAKNCPWRRIAILWLLLVEIKFDSLGLAERPLLFWVPKDFTFVFTFSLEIHWLFLSWLISLNACLMLGSYVFFKVHLFLFNFSFDFAQFKFSSFHNEYEVTRITFLYYLLIPIEQLFFKWELQFQECIIRPFCKKWNFLEESYNSIKILLLNLDQSLLVISFVHHCKMAIFLGSDCCSSVN